MGQRRTHNRTLGALALSLLGASLLLCGCEALGMSPPDFGMGGDDTQPAAVSDTQASAPVAQPVPPPPPEERTPWYANNTTPASQPVPVVTTPPSVTTYDLSANQTTVGKTVVGKKVDAIRAQLDQLEADTNGAVATLNDLHQKSQSLSTSYFSTVGDINSRLQVGTTPGNPHLVQHWQDASNELDQFSAIGGQMSQLSNRMANDASQVSYLLDETRATFGLSGAVDEDHDALKALEDELQKSDIQVTRTRQELTRQIERHNDYVASERRNLETLSLAIARGEYYGQNLANVRSYGSDRDLAPIGGGRVSNMRSMQNMQSGVLTAPASSGPFVVIRFNHPNVDYGQPLYQAMSAALQKNPNGDFTVLAVSPLDASPMGPSAFQKAQDVVGSMAEMGVPRDRISVTTTSKNVPAPEVQVFLR